MGRLLFEVKHEGIIIIIIIIVVMVIIIINHNYCCYHPDYDVVVVVGWQLSRVLLFRVLSRIAWHFLEFCLGLPCLHLEWPEGQLGVKHDGNCRW